MESKQGPLRGAVGWPAALCVPLIASAVLAGCAPGPAAKSTGPADAQCAGKARAQVDAAKTAVKFTFEGPAFDASAAKGKTVSWIATTGDLPFTKAVYAGFEAAAEKAGFKVNFFDGRGQTAEQLRGVQQAVAAKSDLIVLQSIAVGLMGDGVDAAHKAGIPIVEAFTTDAGAPTSRGASASVTFSYSKVGKLLAASAAAGSGCRAKAVVINSSDVPVSVPEMGGIKEGFAEFCPATCKLDIRDAAIADWSTKIGPLTQNAVADQDVNWLIPVYDGMVQFATPAVRQANAGDRVKIASFNASPGIVDDLKSGGPFAVDIGAPLGWTGWAIADQSLRILAGAKPVSDERIPLRILDQDNAEDIDFTGAESAMYGGSYQDQYAKLWGLG
ncbi:sugar ABC transporter substrate-binding protein [Streptomyces naphthomycinicus]|uniref:sugar ABC transporter substrate-binding protein n=1 Tax=Streptomyces naphthomycinicus TaxID=2872625 RepID=UPI001CEC0646|nr:sugar ABC transporter substrate-binding protein [Streptomyces sp. TML10]